MKSILRVSRFETFSFYFLITAITVVGQSGSYAARVAGPAAWMAVLAAGIVSLIVLWLFMWLLRSAGERPLMHAADAVLGRRGAVVFKLVLIIYLIFFVAATLHRCTKVLALYNLNNSGTVLTAALLIFGAAFAAGFSFKGFLRLCGLFMPLAMGFLAVMFCLSYKLYEPGFLFPAFGRGLPAIGRAGFFSLSDMILFWPALIFLDDFQLRGDMRRPAMFGHGAAVLFLTAAAVLTGMAFSHTAPSGSVSLAYDLARAVNLSSLLQNIEPLFIAAAGFGLIAQMALGLLVLRRVGAELFKIPQGRQPVFLRVCAAGIFCLIFLQGDFSVIDDFFSQTMRRYAFLFAAALLAVLFLGAQLRKIKGRRMLRGAAAVLCVSLIAGCLGGCKTYSDIDEILYPTSVGIDAGSEKQYSFTFKLLDSAGGENPEQTESEKTPGNVLTTEADSDEDAVAQINARVPRRLSMSHIRMVMISAELPAREVGDIIYQLYRHRQLKNSVVVMMCEGSAAGALQAKLPEVFGSVEQLAGTLAYTDNNYPLTTIAEFINMYDSPYGDPTLALLGRQGEDSLEPIGSYLFSGASGAGTLTREETRLLHMLCGTFEESSFNVADPLNSGSFVSVTLESGGKPNLSVKNAQSAVISVYLKGQPGASQSRNTDYTVRKNTEQLRRYTEALIKGRLEQLMERLRRDKSDPVRLGMCAAKSFLTVEDFEKYGFKSKYENIKTDIKVLLDM